MIKLKTILLASGLSLLFSMQALAGWVQSNSGQWKYDQDGTILTNNWIEDQGNRYFVGADGVMLTNTTLKIDGKYYTFDASGKGTESEPIQTGVTGNRYYNEKFRYSIEIPNGMPYDVDGNFIELEQGYVYIAIGNVTSSSMSPADDAKSFQDDFLNEMDPSIQYISETDVLLGGFTFKRLHCVESTVGIGRDLYTSVQDTGYIFIITVYSPENEPTIQKTLDSIVKIP